MTTTPLLYIFDFDGTIADTEACIVRTFQFTLEQMAWPMLSATDIRKGIGLALVDMFRCLGMNDAEAKRACNIYREAFDDNAAGRVRLYEGVADTLHQLHAEGHTLAIASSRNTASLEALTKEFGLYNLFSHIMAADTVTHHKPHPEAVLQLLERTGYNAERAVVIGDTTFDISMGNAAGCRTVAVTYGNHSEAELRTALPTFVIHKMTELLDLLS